MAHPTARRLKKERGPVEGRGGGRLFAGELRRALTVDDRRQVAKDLEDLLAWQTDLVRWRKPKSRVDAVPFVALYARGKLCGCFGAQGGEPGERLGRAFLRSLNDTRFGGIPEAARAELAAEVSYARNVTRIDAARLDATFEPGTHGLGVRRDDGTTIVLLPSVARDNGYGTRAMLEALVRKAGLSAPVENLFTFEVERVVVRSPVGDSRKMKRASPADAAAAWLARLVQTDGSILFAIDARSGSATRTGEMHHARTAAAVQALARHGRYPTLVSHARRRLLRDAQRALAGSDVDAWPGDLAKVAGTLAHLSRAGVDVKPALLAMAQNPDVVRVPWHAAQVATALGLEAPESLVRACVADLDVRPWAPWTVLAIANRQDPRFADALSRAVDALVASVRAEGPHRGGVNVTPIPEVALTALTIEALRSVRSTRAVRAAIGRGVAFVSAWQIAAGNAPAAFALEASVGAFVGSPISSGLRADVTAHAYLALTACDDEVKPLLPVTVGKPQPAMAARKVKAR
jgi:AMMECR1 domain-containing protein